jgi:hypothetical protein
MKRSLSFIESSVSAITKKSIERVSGLIRLKEAIEIKEAFAVDTAKQVEDLSNCFSYTVGALHLPAPELIAAVSPRFSV